MTDIRVTFVLHKDIIDEADASEAMIQAYESCKQLVDNISWAKESELKAKKFNKLDYVVFENFEGKDFSKLIESKSAVVGPLAVSVCLMEGKPIPSFQWPILNVALYGCQVTCSQMTKSAKVEVQNKIQLMGGLYTGNFTSSVTHLICNGTKSEKYMLAAERGVKVMLPDWIDHLFEASKLSNINANDQEILKKYACLPFHNLTICTTGITSNKEKTKLSEIISAYGGKMVAKLNLSEADVLICHGIAGTTSEKYKAARKTRISCVTLNWVYDSVGKGYALPHETYYVKTVTSTPTKEGENMDPNFSTISCIGTTSIRQSTINESVNTTQMSTAATVAGITTSKKRKVSDDLVEKIDIKKVKKAGQFLDGCSIFVTGFSAEGRDKLNKIVNLSGATRYDDFSERVTHIIVGDPNCHEVTMIKAMGTHCVLVSIEWLLDSVEQQRPAKEDKYLITNKDLDDDAEKGKIGSPLSKMALSLLKSTNIIMDNKKDKAKLQEPVVEQDDPLTQQYLKNATSEKDEEDTLAMLLKDQDLTPLSKKEEFNLRTRSFNRQEKSREPNQIDHQTFEFKPHETSTQVSQVTSDISENDTDVIPIFSSYTFFLEGFSEEYTESYKEYIIGVGGTIVDNNFKGEIDYAVVPLFNQPENLPAVREIVNDLWIIQSIKEECACDILYYHRPMTLPSSKPLKDCVITISVYAGQERHFLNSLIEELGGIFQEQFSRKDSATRNILASTHLVSPEASGKKYEAALKWNLPVVTKDWLLECARTGTKLNVIQYLISNTKTANNTSVNNDSKRSNSSSNDSGPVKHGELCQTITSKQNNKSSTKHDNDRKSTLEDDVFTPVKESKDDTMKTPQHQIYNSNQNDTPEVCSQVTPVNTVLQRFNAINGNILPLSSPRTYYPWDPKTPDTPLGAFIRDNPSPRLRKEMQKYVNSFPDFVPPKQRRNSTPLSELKRRLRNKVLGIGEYPLYAQDEPGPNSRENPQSFNDESKNTRKASADINFGGHQPTENPDKEPAIVNVEVHQKLQELQQKVMANGSASATRRSSRMFEASTNPPGIIATDNEVQSQVCTVGWDYGEAETQTPPQKIFLLSGIEATQRERLSNELKNLGGTVSERNTYDGTCTHLICPKPARNEKTLACMAAGKWILHFSYVEKCVKAGKFLDEEEFEFGNPKARENISHEEKYCSIYFWRKEVKRRGYGAFNDMRAIVIAENKEPITNVIEAGGGVVIHVAPLFSDSIHATHCLLEMKMIKDFSKYVPLAQQGIKCVNTIYINDFLWRIIKEDSDYIIPHFAKYY